MSKESQINNALRKIELQKALLSKIQEEGLVPYIRVVQKGYRNSWYNRHVGKCYKLIGISQGGLSIPYYNYIVESNMDGTKMGYSPMGRGPAGKGKDCIHSFAGELITL